MLALIGLMHAEGSKRYTAIVRGTIYCTWTWRDRIIRARCL